MLYLANKNHYRKPALCQLSMKKIPSIVLFSPLKKIDYDYSQALFCCYNFIQILDSDSISHFIAF